MINNNKEIFNRDINKSLLKLLLYCFPTNEKVEVLLDIINVLMDGLNRGEIYIDIKNKPDNIELKSSGWPHTHKDALLSSGWTKGDLSPIYLNNNQISWRRYHSEMNNCIQELLKRSNLKKDLKDNPKHFSNHEIPKRFNKDQKKAVMLMNKENIILLSGGPGTGKTSTILQMLLRALSLKPNLIIGLAAPTGKATKRLQESIHKGMNKLDESNKNMLSKIPCQTLHKWLKANINGFGKNKNHPLRIDLLVIDEMSMVDLNLFQALLNALPEKSQLILIGDPNQLPPVGIGPIWHVLQSKDTNQMFNNNSIQLNKLYRNKGDLILLSRELKEKGIKSFWEKLSNLNNKESNIRNHKSSLLKLEGPLIDKIKQHKSDLKILSIEASNSIPLIAWSSSMVEIAPTKQVDKVINKLENLLILCPRKNGHGGINILHKSLLGSQLEGGVLIWEEGTPVICGHNQSDLGLANGDIGIVIKKRNERRLLFNLISDNQKIVTRLIHPSRVKSLEPAFAITIHKAQGSEANDVILLWPYASTNINPNPNEENEDDFQKKLIYTAITRAKKHVDIISSLDPKSF